MCKKPADTRYAWHFISHTHCWSSRIQELIDVVSCTTSSACYHYSFLPSSHTFSRMRVNPEVRNIEKHANAIRIYSEKSKSEQEQRSIASVVHVIVSLLMLDTNKSAK